MVTCLGNKKDNSQPKEGDLSTMNVPCLQYDNTMDQINFSKSPHRFMNDTFSPTQTRTNTKSSYGKKVRSPPGRNISNNFTTIGKDIVFYTFCICTKINEKRN